MRFLIAGLGSIGQRHLRNLRALGEQDILLYRTHKGTLHDPELAGLPVETDLDAALAHAPNAVIVSNPTALHMQVAIPAARAGCHIFLEKPVANDLDSVQELRKAVGAGGGQVFVGFQFRFHPGLRAIKQLLDTKAIGQLLSVRAHWGEYLPAWHPWEDYRKSYSARSDLGGGVILTLSHPLDYMRWLCGEIYELWAFASHVSDLELLVEDCAEMGLRFENGCLGSVHLDYNQQPPAHRLELIGSTGTMRWDNADGAAHIYRTATKEWETIAPPQGFERNDLFLAEMEHFLAVCRGEALPTCNLDDGIRALELALAAKRSQTERKLIRPHGGML